MPSLPRKYLTDRDEPYPEYPEPPPPPPKGLESTFHAIFAVQQNTPRLVDQIAFYAKIGMIIDHGAELADGETLPDVWYSARGIKREDLVETVAMNLPADPYMHLWLHSFTSTGLSTKAQWPPVYNQIGSRGLTFLVDDVEKEIKRIKAQFPKTPILHEPLKVKRKWGDTVTALVKDPEGQFLEILSVAGDRFDGKNAKTPAADDRSWLHFQVNAVNYDEMGTFYRGFNMEHDHGVDYRGENGTHGWPPRPDLGEYDGFAFFKKQMIDAFGFVIEDKMRRCDFLRNERDVSNMHLEILEVIPKNLKLPGLDPTWSQNGIVRYCMKTPSHTYAVKQVKELGAKIFCEDQRGHMNWGDSQYIFYGDRDGNLLCLEQWHPQRVWGSYI